MGVIKMKRLLLLSISFGIFALNAMNDSADSYADSYIDGCEKLVESCQKALQSLDTTQVPIADAHNHVMQIYTVMSNSCEQMHKFNNRNCPREMHVLNAGRKTLQEVEKRELKLRKELRAQRPRARKNTKVAAQAVRIAPLKPVINKRLEICATGAIGLNRKRMRNKKRPGAHPLRESWGEQSDSD